MQDEGFKKWLAEGGANSEDARRTRVSSVKKIERQLKALGFDWQNLDQAWEANGFEALKERILQLREDSKAGGQDYRILMPDSENPTKRLSSWHRWLTQYGRYLAGEPPGRVRDADQIRDYVLENYIEVARKKDSASVEVLVRDVNDALELNQAWPNICQAISGKKFQELASVSEPERIGANQSPATVFRFHLSEAIIERSVLEEMRHVFMHECPDFQSFSEPSDSWSSRESDYKLAAVARVHDAMLECDDHEELGRRVFEIMKNAASDGPLVRWQTEDAVKKSGAGLASGLYASIGKLVATDAPIDMALAAAFDALESLQEQGAKALTFGERINILYSAAGMARPDEAAPLKVTVINGAWKALTGQPVFVASQFDARKDYATLSVGISEILSVMRDDWRWEPRDWLDVQGFLWIAMQGRPEFYSVDSRSTKTETGTANAFPTNLVLYGPPGTGKTFATAAEALRLCGEAVPDQRQDVMEAYARLCAEKRIEFVTFHQSMSYEDFVEGRQPVTGDSDGEGDGTGFRLETIPGIFRRIARRAEASKGSAHGSRRISLEGRQILKMSIGEAANPDDAHLFEEAIEGGYTLLGFGDIDWSDEKFSDVANIIEECKANSSDGEKITAHVGPVQMPNIFRNGMKIGDLIIVSKGNSLFRAIGEVVGEYEFHPRPEGRYAHRRKVKWLWVDRDGVSVDEVYSRKFSMKSVYWLYDSELNVPALERYANSQIEDDPGDPEQFVLIVDEINRANISKVFGELITLLEPDKRLGQINQIKVRLPYSGDDFGVPSNLHILGTMNTADRSIALLDTALRRRFEFRELLPEPDVLNVAAERSGIDLPKLLRTLNERIEYLYDRDHQIGHAYFIHCESKADVDAVMRDKVIPLLAEYFFEDWGKIAVILGDAEPGDSETAGGFLNKTLLNAPPGMDDEGGEVRARWAVRPDSFSYDRLLRP